VLRDAKDIHNLTQKRDAARGGPARAVDDRDDERQ
jgi:hypothetical protein